jgi:regulator of cell morphogenesis and NO signaling
MNAQERNQPETREIPPALDILGELRADHDQLRAEMAALEAGGIERDRAARFAHDLVFHAHSEDELLFAELEHDLPPDHGPIAVMRAEHVEIESGLERIVAGATPAEVRRFCALARGHFLKEEEVLFAFALRLVGGARLAELGAELRTRRRKRQASACAGEPIDPETTVAELAREWPATIRVFQRHGLDFCCGGKRPLSEACAEKGLAYAALARELEAAIAGSGGADETVWSERPTAELVGHILARYHAGLREELARLEAMAERARERHGAEHTELVRIAALTAKLRRTMVEHLALEEREIFPALMADRAETVRAALYAATSEHEEVGTLFAALREASGGFAPPEWACNTWRGLYAGLEELERETHVHVHLENNVLFPQVAPAVAACR